VKVRLLKQAQAEVDAVFERFEAESQGKGHHFLNCLDEDVARLSVVAGVHSKLFGFQRMKMRRFDHIIFYEIQPGQIDVVAIIDGRGHPDSMEQRMKNAKQAAESDEAT
jgi:hypothetical protein